MLTGLIKRLSITLTLSLFVIALASPGASDKIKNKQVLKDVTSSEAREMIQKNLNDPRFIILDVRTVAEFQSGYIENARNIDYYSASFRGDLDKLDKDKTYLIYCRSGSRSGKTLETMGELDFKEVYNLRGGIQSWIINGYPLEKK